MRYILLCEVRPSVRGFPAHREVRAARAFVPQPDTKKCVRFRFPQTALPAQKNY